MVRGLRRAGRWLLRVRGPLGLTAAGLLLAACGPPTGFVSGADIDREAEDARAVTPLPPGATYPSYTHDPGGAYQPGSGRSEVEFQAMCAWFRYWAEAIAKDDQAAIDRASTMWDEMRTWSPYRVADAARRRHLDSIVERARLGDPSGFLDEVKLNCS